MTKETSPKVADAAKKESSTSKGMHYSPATEFQETIIDEFTGKGTANWRWEQRHPERRKDIKRIFALRHPEYTRDYARDYKKKNHDRILINENRRRHERRKRLIALLGEKCVVCGEADWRCLQVDHINGGGSKERKQLGHEGMYRRVEKHPEEYQILCANHNMIKAYETREELIVNVLVPA